MSQALYLIMCMLNTHDELIWNQGKITAIKKIANLTDKIIDCKELEFCPRRPKISIHRMDKKQRSVS